MICGHLYRCAHDRSFQKNTEMKTILVSRKAEFVRAKAEFITTKRIYLAVDFEQWEQDHSKITEVGLSILDTTSNDNINHDAIKTRHILIKESVIVPTSSVSLMLHRNVHYRNGKYVADSSQLFRHGQSEVRCLSSAKGIIESYMRQEHCKDVALVFHDAKADMRTMQAMGIVIAPAMQIYDTRDLFAARQHATPGTFVSLAKMLDELDIFAVHLHNAGNDSHGTMQAFLHICSEG